MSTPAKLKLTLVPLDDVALFGGNPKLHDIGGIIESIQRYGFRDAPIADATLGTLVAGHGRVQALRAMRDNGDPAPRGIVVRNGAWLVPVQSGVDAETPEEAQAFLVDHNNLTVTGGNAGVGAVLGLWDEKELTEVLRRLGEAGELPVTLDGDDLDALLAPPPPDVPAGVGASEVEGLVEQWGVTEGQLWRLGEHLVLCGDATDAASVGHLLAHAASGDDHRVALCFADPPYGMGKHEAGVTNDNLSGDRLQGFLAAWWSATRPVLADNASVYLWGLPEVLWRLWWTHLHDTEEHLVFRNEIVWAKTGGVVGTTSDTNRCYPPAGERCLFFMLGRQGFGNLNKEDYWEGWEPLRQYLVGERKAAGWRAKDVNDITGTNMHGHWFTRSQFQPIPRHHYEALQAAADGAAFGRSWDELGAYVRDLGAYRAYFDNTHEAMTDVWEYPRVLGEERWGHATPKPAEMVARCVRTSAAPGALVLDPFLGTGTTLVVCQQTGRRCLGLDVEPRWVAATIERWHRMTGEEPEVVEVAEGGNTPPVDGTP